MKIVSFIGLSVLLSCTEWTPEATGSFSVGQKKYSLILATIEGGNLYFRSKPGYYIEMWVPPNGLKNISYPFVYSASSPARISWIRVLQGASNQITSDINTTGTLTIKVTGNDYTFDFSGVIQGQQVTLHYQGLIQTLR